MRRVAITGMGIYSPIGNTIETVKSALKEGKSGIRAMEEWKKIRGLKSLVAGSVEGFDPKVIPRQFRRTMGRMAILGALATKDAVNLAKLKEEEITSTRTGVAMGSTTGSGAVIEQFMGDFVRTTSAQQQEGTTFMKVMGHTVAANVAAFLGVKGRLLPVCSACASSTQAIGAGYESIRDGMQDVMICGGADDLHPTTAIVFDILNAASRNFNDTPTKTPRPFDRKRDGLVVSEGAAALVLEEYERARKRSAKIYGEVVAYGTCCDGRHMTFPSKEGMLRCMEEALQNANLSPGIIDYINVHATGTIVGDDAEAEAIRTIWKDTVPVSGTKGYTGHTLAACGAMEVIFCLIMMQDGFLAPTLNLDEVAPECAGIQHIQQITDAKLNCVMSNNFAFGGVNASLIIRKDG